MTGATQDVVALVAILILRSVITMASTRTLPSGKHQGRYRDGSGKQRYTPAVSSIRAARRAAEEEEAKVRNGIWLNPDNAAITFSDYFEHHWLPAKRAEATTIESYISNYRARRNGLAEVFGNTPLAKIRSGMVQRWVSDMESQGVSPRTIKGRADTLRVVLGGRKGVSAVRDGRLLVNPVAGVELPPIRRRQVDVYSVAEADLVMSRLHPWVAPIALLGADTGWRWGELLGLQVSDFAPDFTRVQLNRTIEEVPVSFRRERDSAVGPFSIKDYPKEVRARSSVSISEEVSTVLAAMVSARQLFGNDRMFSVAADRAHTKPKRTAEWPQGRPISRSNFRSRYWLPAHVNADGEVDVEIRRFHDLRGSHISWLLTNKADLLAVMNQVGHTQITTTQFYADAMADADARVQAGLARARARGRSEEPRGRAVTTSQR